MKDKNKTLLSESTIRRFMKLAELNPLTKNFFDKNVQEEEAVDEGGMAYDRDEELPGEELPGEELPGEELPGEELPGEEPAEGPVDEADVKDLVDAIADAITQSTGIEVSASSEGEELGEPEGELPGEELPGEELPGEELPAEEEPMLEAEEDLEEASRGMEKRRDRPGRAPGLSPAAEEEEETEEEKAQARADLAMVKKGGGEKRKLEEDDEALVADITRRVAERLQDASKREEIATQLAERIFNKLSKKG